MAVKFNADEILDMAIKIEQNGQAFYRKAAEQKKSMGDVDFLIELAEMEEEHEQTFSDMKDKLSDEEKAETVYDPMGEAELYLEAMADSHGGEGDPDKAAELTGDETLEDILNIAVGLEKESILFYLGLIDMVPENLGKDRIDNIISEERSHVAILSKKLKSL